MDLKVIRKQRLSNAVERKSNGIYKECTRKLKGYSIVIESNVSRTWKKIENNLSDNLKGNLKEFERKLNGTIKEFEVSLKVIWKEVTLQAYLAPKFKYLL